MILRRLAETDPGDSGFGFLLRRAQDNECEEVIKNQSNGVAEVESKLYTSSVVGQKVHHSIFAVEIMIQF